MNGRIRLTRADFASEEEFLRWKQWSDEDYYEMERRERGYYDNGVPLDENISAEGAVESAEDAYFRELLADEIEAARKALCQERMAKVKALLTARQSRRIWMYLAEEKSITEIANEIPDEMDGEDNLDNEPAQLPNRQAVDIVEASGLNYTVLRPGYLKEGEENDFVLSVKGEPAKGYVTTIPSLVKLAVQLISDETLYARESVSITRDAAKEG